MFLFACLLLAHLIADFYLQPHAWIMSKVEYKIRSIGLLKHIGVHTILTSIALFAGGVAPSSSFLIALLFIISTHYAIDVWKTYMGFTTRYFLIDQSGHLIILICASLWLLNVSFQQTIEFIRTQLTINVLIYVTAYFFAFKPLSILMQLLLRPYLKQVEENGQTNTGLQAAGEYIGTLERFLVITFVLLDQFAGIGFLLAAKSVFRFGDMRRQQDRKLTEYIMLGTLLSFTFALVIGLLIKHLAAVI